MNLTNASIRSWTRAGAAALAIGAIALAGCSSSSGSKSSDSNKTSTTSKAATSSTTKAADSSSTTAATECATQDQATAALGTNGSATAAPICIGKYAAGDATNGQVDFAYLLVNENGSWTQASEAVQQDVCTTNTEKLPQQFVDAACDD